MKFLALFAAVLLTVSASTDKDEWVAFKQTHGKSYESLLEERTRFEIFQNNLRKIEEHNAKYASGEKSYHLAVTRFTDLTHDEFKHMLTLQSKTKPDLNATVHEFPENLEVPSFINWVAKGAVLKVKNQSECGACWAFSVTGSLEGQNAILNKVRKPLSEQQLIDCSGDYLNSGCEGGLMFATFRYIEDYGIESESSYPYVGEDRNCSYDAEKVILKIEGYKEIEPTEEELEKAVGTIGPISVAVNAKYLHLYGGGILNEPDCDDDVDHGVLAAGYGSFGNSNFWIVKNSWGSDWGESGYFKLAKDVNNMCGIASMAYYPLLN